MPATATFKTAHPARAAILVLAVSAFTVLASCDDIPSVVLTNRADQPVFLEYSESHRGQTVDLDASVRIHQFGPREMLPGERVEITGVGIGSGTRYLQVFEAYDAQGELVFRAAHTMPELEEIGWRIDITRSIANYTYVTSKPPTVKPDPTIAHEQIDTPSATTSAASSTGGVTLPTVDPGGTSSTTPIVQPSPTPASGTTTDSNILSP